MSKGDNGANKGLDLMRGVYQWWQDMEMGEDVLIRLVMTRTKRKGVFSLELKVFDPRQPERVLPIVRDTVEWPNARVQGLEAALMALTISCSRLLDDHVLDTQKPLRDPWK